MRHAFVSSNVRPIAITSPTMNIEESSLFTPMQANDVLVIDSSMESKSLVKEVFVAYEYPVAMDARKSTRTWDRRSMMRNQSYFVHFNCNRKSSEYRKALFGQSIFIVYSHWSLVQG